MSDEEQIPAAQAAHDANLADHHRPSAPISPVAGAGEALQAPPDTPAEEVKIEMAPCPCGSDPGLLRIETTMKGAKIGQARGSCCGSWAIEFINNTDNPQLTFQKAAAAWNAAPRAA